MADTYNHRSVPYICMLFKKISWLHYQSFSELLNLCMLGHTISRPGYTAQQTSSCMFLYQIEIVLSPLTAFLNLIIFQLHDY